jgi:hypothetical protein
LVEPRDAGEEDGREILTPTDSEPCVDGRWHLHSGVQHRNQVGQLGRDHVVEELNVLRRPRGVEPVLRADRNHDLVDERLAQTRDLDPVADALQRAVIAGDPSRLAVRRRPHADHRIVVDEPVDRNPQRQRVDIEPGHVVLAGSGGERDHVGGVEGRQPGEIEHRPEVDEERVVPRPSEG